MVFGLGKHFESFAPAFRVKTEVDSIYKSRNKKSAARKTPNSVFFNPKSIDETQPSSKTI